MQMRESSNLELIGFGEQIPTFVLTIIILSLIGMILYTIFFMQDQSYNKGQENLEEKKDKKVTAHYY